MNNKIKNMTKLKLCPLCGRLPKMGDTEGGDYIITCECGLEIMDDLAWEFKDYDGEENVISKWNNRQVESVTSGLTHCNWCSEKDLIFTFKVQDYTTELVGRYHADGDFYYVQRGDGFVRKYDADRVENSKELIKE